MAAKGDMGSLSSLAAAAVFLSLLAVGHCAAADFNATDADADFAGNGVDFNSSDAAVYWGPWTKARATWYGQPNGAGPDDNGTACDIFARFSSSSPTICCFFPAMWLTKS